MKYLWIITFWTDVRDYEAYKKHCMNSHGSVSGYGLYFFYPIRWIIRIIVWMVVAGLAVALLGSIK